MRNARTIVVTEAQQAIRAHQAPTVPSGTWANLENDMTNEQKALNAISLAAVKFNYNLRVNDRGCVIAIINLDAVDPFLGRASNAQRSTLPITSRMRISDLVQSINEKWLAQA